MMKLFKYVKPWEIEDRHWHMQSCNTKQGFSPTFCVWAESSIEENSAVVLLKTKFCSGNTFEIERKDNAQKLN